MQKVYNKAKADLSKAERALKLNQNPSIISDLLKAEEDAVKLVDDKLTELTRLEEYFTLLDGEFTKFEEEFSKHEAEEIKKIVDAAQKVIDDENTKYGGLKKTTD